MRVVKSVAIGGILSTLVACMGGRPLYTTSAQEQRRHLDAIEPPQLQPTGSYPGAPAVVPVVAYADDRHRRQVRDWKARFRTQVEAANPMLRACCGLELRVVRLAGWTGDHSGDLRLALQTLFEDKSAEGRVVVGLLAPMTFDATSFRDLGVAHVGGRHFVMRGLDDVVMAEGLAQVVPNVSSEVRRRFYRAVLRHKEQSILLHELGHLLELPHESDPTSIMNEEYSWSISGFSPASLELLVQNRSDLARLAPGLVAGAEAGKPGRPARNDVVSKCLMHADAMGEDTVPAAWQQTIDICRHAIDHSEVSIVVLETARAMIALERWAEAEDMMEEAQRREAASPWEGEHPSDGRLFLGQTQMELGQLAAAESTLDGLDHPNIEEVKRRLEARKKLFPELATTDLPAVQQGRLYRALDGLWASVGSTPAPELRRQAAEIEASYAGATGAHRILCRTWSGDGPDPYKHCRPVLRRHPDDVDALFWSAKADLRFRRFQSAVRKLDRAVKLDPGHEDAVALRDTVRRALGR